MEQLARITILLGVIFIVIGGVLFVFARFFPAGLPGDIIIRKKSFTFIFPLATSLLLSIILTVILNWILRK